MLAMYRISTIGRVVVVYAPEDSGKTRAAEYMIHGNHPHCPDCSLMLSAASMKDFPRDFSSLMGAACATPVLSECLCVALSEPSSSRATDIVAEAKAAQAGDAVERIYALCSLPQKRAFEKEITMYGPGLAFPQSSLKGLALLILDNFNEVYVENQAFVKKLLQEASQYNVFIFIMTSNRDWATTLVGLNGGSKIKPLYGNVNNTDYKIYLKFSGVPDWNTLPWTIECLREFIRPDCEACNIAPATVVPDSTLMSPVEAMDKLANIWFG